MEYPRGNGTCILLRAGAFAVVVALAAAMFLAAALTLVSGGTTLITIPLMVAFGIEPRTAIATSTAMLTLMSLGGTLGFLRGGAIDWPKAIRLGVLSGAGAALGAVLLFSLAEGLTRILIVVTMVSVLVFMLWHRPSATFTPSRTRQAAGYTAALALAIYGGMLRGGYGTLLTAVCRGFFGLGMLQSVATARVVNLVVSVAATAVFASRKAINWEIVLWLGSAAMAGALVGARVTQRVPEKWLKVVFASGVACLAAKALVDLVRSAARP